MDTMQNFVNVIINQPTSTWTTLGAYLGGSTIVATVLQLVKHKFSITDRKKLVTFLLGAFSFLAALGDFVISTANQSPKALGSHTAIILGGAVLVHRFMVSPVYHKVVVSLKSLVDDAKAYRAATTPPAEVSEASAEPQQFQVP